MEGGGVIITLADRVWKCYSECERASGSFGDLHLDLRSLHAALLAAGPLLPEGEDLSALQIGCERIISDIGKLLSKYDSLGTTRQRFRHKFGWSSADADNLRSRLTAQVSMLTLYLSVKNAHHLRGQCPHDQSHEGLSRPRQPTGSSGEDGEQSSVVVCQELQNFNTSTSSIEAAKFPARQRTTLHQLCPDTPPSLASTTSLISTHKDQNPHFISSCSNLSNSTSSLASSEREYHSLFATLKAKFKRPRSKFIAAAEGGDITALLGVVYDRAQRLQLNQKSINKAMIAVSSNEKREREQTPVIRLLLDQNAELEYKDEQYGRTPLIWAVTVGREDIVDVLLDYDALIETRDEVADWTPLMWAAWWGNEAIVKQLINRGACLDAADNTWERTPLLWAAKRGAYGAVEILLQTEQGRNLIETKDKKQLTPLALAYLEGHETVATTLLNHGANPNSALTSGMPLLISAITAGDSIFVHLLISKGADIHCKNREGIPALSVAVREEHPSIVKFLITKGASLEVKDGQGRTALVWAIGRARGDLVELLIRSGADKFAEDNEGRTVRKWAELTQDERIIELVSGKG